MKIYPISEIFTSPQGEGVYTGTLMTFIRLAGCTVGKPFPNEKHGKDPLLVGTKLTDHFGILPIYVEMCTTYDGRQFPCDTDYRVKERLNVYQIAERIGEGVKHVCLTGGEPLMHDITELIELLDEKDIKVHIETSGSIAPKSHVWWSGFTITSPWITVSPKKGVLPEVVDRADEIKLLVDEQFDLAVVPQFILNHDCIFIQPINFEHTVNTDNLKRCLELQKQHPHLRLSTQMHKIWNVR